MIRRLTNVRAILLAFTVLLLFLSGVAVLIASSAPATSSPTASSTARARANLLYEQGKAQGAANRFAEAAKLFEKAIALDPGHSDARAALGWALYRLADYARSSSVFREGVRLEPRRADAWTGLGYALLQKGDHAGAEEALAKARALSPKDTDAIKGMGLLYLRTGRAAQSIPLLEQVVAASPPGDQETRAALRQALSQTGRLTDRRLRPPEGSGLSVPFRAGNRYFEVREGDGWRPILLKGVNLGVALPGKFPSQFPEEESLYRDWLGKIRAMNANTVRLYTLLPPVFYAALAKENRAHPEAPVYLVQGVWVELPPENDFSDAAFNEEYTAEIRRVIDAVHGNIEVVPRPGHAAGLYDTDVSRWLLGIILGREWEPYAVQAYDERNSAQSARMRVGFEGKYVRVPRTGTSAPGTPTECWVASTLETAAEHLAERYGESRPLAFTNWPTLDPLHHPTEASRQEEDAILRKRGTVRPPARGAVYDNDSVSIDAEKMVTTPLWPAGLFASYHAYPYFPDFMILDPGYLASRDSKGPSAYSGYLRDLVQYHAGRPVLISEFGVPTSRGIAHRQPQGFDHGGHNEASQAAIDARLFQDIRETGCAGGIVFSWLDEWFKHNWLVQDLESPAERKPLWLNALDPEENFGIIAAVAGPPVGGIVLDGKTEDWRGITPLYPPREGLIRAFYVTSDEAYLYMRLDVEPSREARVSKDGEVRARSASPGSSASEAPVRRKSKAGWTWWIGIDTYDRVRGDKRLPGLNGPLITSGGLEYAIRLDGGDARILVDAPYDIGTHRNSGPYASTANESGNFIDMQAEIRMERIGRDGTVYPAERNDLSPLRRGSTDLASSRYDSLADYDADPAHGVYEIRIPWNLLNVTDPSSRRVVHQTTQHHPPIDTTVTDGFTFYLAAVPDGASQPEDGRPSKGEQTPLFTWRTWESPRYQLRPKAVYEALRKSFGEADVPAQGDVSVEGGDKR